MLRHFLFGLSPSHLCIIRIYSIPLEAYETYCSYILYITFSYGCIYISPTQATIAGQSEEWGIRKKVR